MPQMSPLMWTSLFMMFTISLILFNQMIFFSYKSTTIKIPKKKINPENLNWKW